MIIDNKTKEYFKNVKQVFLYINDRCNLLCEQCLYKPNVVMGRSIDCNVAIELLKTFADMGAYKLTLLGGEISLYDYENNWETLVRILREAKKYGYRYIRIDTNGQIKTFFENEYILELIDEISFSIDGYNPETNDVLRGEGAFEKAKESIYYVKNKNKSPIVNITTCVTKQNTELAGGIHFFIKKMVLFSENIGANQINFHGVFKMGVPMDTWTGRSHLSARKWYEEMNRIREDNLIVNNRDKVRLPLHIISKEEFDRHPRYYGYCPCKLGERALIHPDGIIRVCSSMLSTPYGVAHYNMNEIVWNEFNNELCEHKMQEYTPCTNQKGLYTDNLCPICFSIKPYQNEMIWKDNNVEKLREKNQ